MMAWRGAWIVAFVVLMASSALAAEESAKADDKAWGTLTGRFIVEGKAPRGKNKKARITSDESFAVDSKTRALANVFVWLRAHKPSVHPSYQEVDLLAQKLEVRDNRYVPHALVVRTGVPLTIRNLDPGDHEAGIRPSKNPAVNVALSNEKKFETVGFDHEEPQPIAVDGFFSSAWILIRSDPYAAISDVEGRFKIEHLPVGEWEFRIWHERAGNITAFREDQRITDTKGRAKFVIAAGQNDVGDIVLPVRQFQQW